MSLHRHQNETQPNKLTMHPYTHIRQIVHCLLTELSQTQQLSHAVKRAAETLQDDDTLSTSIQHYRTFTRDQSKQFLHTTPRPEQLVPFINTQLADSLNSCRIILVACALRKRVTFVGCVNDTPFEYDQCTYNCDFNQPGAYFKFYALIILGMCEANLTAYCAVILGFLNGVIPVYSKKIKPKDGKFVVVADDNVCFDARPGQGMHCDDVKRFAARAIFHPQSFNHVLQQNSALKLATLSYTKLLYDFQSLFGLEGPLGGSFLCSYFEARQGSWGLLFFIVRKLCQEQADGQVDVRDHEGNILSVSVTKGHISIDHQNVRNSVAGLLASPVVQSWTTDDMSARISCLYDRENIAAILSRLKWHFREQDSDDMMLITSAVSLVEQKGDAEMALRDLKLYENVFRKTTSMRDENHVEKITDELIDNHTEMPKVYHNEWWDLAKLLESYEEGIFSDSVDVFNLSDWAREIRLVAPGENDNGMQVLPKEGWFPSEYMKRRSQCHYKKSLGSLSISNERLRMTRVPKFLVGVVHFAKRTTGLGVSGVVQIELGKHKADEASATAGVLYLAISGCLGDACALWALEAIYVGKVSMSPESPSSIKNCAKKLDKNGYVLETVMPSRIFNQVEVVTDQRNVFALLGIGFRCVKVVKKSEMKYMLEPAVLEDTVGMKHGIISGGRTVG